MRNEIESILEDFNNMAVDPPEAIDRLCDLHNVSGSALLEKAKQMQKENQYLIDSATVNADKEHKEAIGIGIDRIIRLIERHYR